MKFKVTYNEIYYNMFYIQFVSPINDGTNNMIIDKLALAGGKAEEHVMGNTMKFQTIRETLSYNTDTDLDLKHLDSIISEIVLNDISKKADAHQVKVVENILDNKPTDFKHKPKVSRFKCNYSNFFTITCLNMF